METDYGNESVGRAAQMYRRVSTSAADTKRYICAAFAQRQAAARNPPVRG